MTPTPALGLLEGPTPVEDHPQAERGRLTGGLGRLSGGLRLGVPREDPVDGSGRIGHEAIARDGHVGNNSGHRNQASRTPRLNLDPPFCRGESSEPEI